MPSQEPSFKESVDLMFDRAVATLDLPPGLADQIKINNNIYLVRSGLEDTMSTAYQTMSEIHKSRDNVPDLRTAAFVIAIEKIARAYIEMGL